MFMTRILTYNREEIEKFIKKYPDTKDIFEKCGNFLKDNYLILSNYDNEEVRRDLLREMRKFEDFKVERK